MADKAHRLTDEKLEEMEKRLSAIYSRAEKEIQKTADEYFSKFAKQDEDKRKLLEHGKITEDEYRSWRKGKIMYGKRFTQMKEQCAQQILRVNETAMAYVNGQLPEIYSLNYNAISGDVDGIGGYSFSLTDADTVRNLATSDASLLPYREIDPAKDIPWNTKQINAEVLQGILQGESIDKIAERMAKVVGMDETAAIRNARTMVTSAECKGRQDSYVRAQNDGIIMQRRWIAAKDSRTRHWHAELDGALAAVDEPFENAIGTIMYPGDPHADGANVYNCRCTIAAKVISFGGVKVSENTRKNQPKALTHNDNNATIKAKEQSKKTKATTDTIGSDAFSAESKKQLLRAEMINNGNRYETAYVFDEHGKIKFKVKGSANEVSFTSKQIKEMKGCVITHNHPNNSSFSSDDIYMLKRTGASEIRASTSFGTYVLQRPAKWSSEIGTYEKIDKDYNFMLDDYIIRYKDKAAQDGKHPLAYLQKAEEDATRAFAEKYGMSFKVEKYNVADLQYGRK